jgi:hypothetical protein
VGTKKRALIITDGSKPIRLIALSIKETLVGFKVKICTVKKFSGDELLPVDVFFIGSKRQKPKSFAGLETFLSHINLASRKCSVFSVNEKALNYLRSILTDSEANVAESLIMNEEEINKSSIEEWINKII